MRNYNGNPANITTPLSRTVAGAANNGGGLVRVQTTVAHMFATDDDVQVIGVVGVPGANVTAQINVIDATHFDLRGSTFSGAYVSGGTATDLSLTPYVAFPDDGEPGTAQSIEASIQNALDKVAFAWLNRNNIQHADFLTDGNFTWPNGVDILFFLGWGQGGGGGGGTTGNSGGDSTAPGGGGGGAAPMVFGSWSGGTPGDSYGVLIGGSGGLTGLGGAANTLGGDGAATQFVDPDFTTVRWAAPGGGGGGAKSTPGGGSGVVWGGVAAGSNKRTNGAFSTDSSTTISYQVPEGGGGFGTTGSSTATAGSDSRAVNTIAGGIAANAMYLGGAGAGPGSPSGGFTAGGGGGGGAGGPAGDGGASGAGGNANSVGNGSPGAAGSSAGANSGAAGGGGGGGGSASGTGGTGGRGGNGGTGFLRIFWFATG